MSVCCFGIPALIGIIVGVGLRSWRKKRKKKKGADSPRFFSLFLFPSFTLGGRGRRRRREVHHLGVTRCSSPFSPFLPSQRSGRLRPPRDNKPVASGERTARLFLTTMDARGKPKLGLSYVRTPTKKPRSTFLNRSERSTMFPSLFFEQRTHSGLI